ncbi:MAG: M14 family zinc carboxypeptidase [Polyangia bacterium]
MTRSRTLLLPAAAALLLALVEQPVRPEPTAPPPAPAPTAPAPSPAPSTNGAPEDAATTRYSAAWVEATLRDYHARFPKLTRLVELGRSHEGRTIWGLAIGRGLKRRDGRPAVLLNGAHHGVELVSIDMALDAAEVLLLRAGEIGTDGQVLRRDPALDAQVKRWLDELVVWCVPVVNPDGVWASLHGNPRTGRKNGRDTNRNGRIDRTDGVDLNRNYPFRWGFLGDKGSSPVSTSYYYRGPEPASEPETRAMLRLAESERFVAAISFHSGSVAVLAPYTIDNVKSPTPNEAWSVAEELVAGLPPHPQDRTWTVRQKLYPVDGTDQDTLRASYGTLALLVEGARGDPGTPQARREVVLAARPLWTRLLDRYLNGPSLQGHVVDANGRPAVAEVTVAEVALNEQERWTSRCRDGRFDRYLAGPGRYTVQARLDGQVVAAQIVEAAAGSGPVRVQLTVPAPTKPPRCPPDPR